MADNAKLGSPNYAMIDLATTSFVFAPEYRMMTGIDPFVPEQIESVIELICDFLGISEPHVMR